MKNMLKTLLALTLALMLLATAALADTKATTTGKADNTMTIPIVQEISTLDPAFFSKQVEDDIIVQMYEPVFLLDNDGNIQPVLAESYTVNEDGSRVEVTLKAGIQFHSGDTLTAEDVAYSLSRCENSPLTSTLYAYSAIEVTGDLDLVWTFPLADQGASFYDLGSYLTSLNIVNQSYCESVLANSTDDLGTHEDGTGAYQLVDVAGNGDVTLKRFEAYWGTASLDTLYFRLVTGSSALAFESGDIDMSRYDAPDLPTIEGFDNVNVQAYAANNTAFLIMNCSESSAFQDIRVREAATLAMDRDTVASVASDDAGMTAYNLANPNVTYYADVCEHYDMDLAKANALLEEAGYGAGKKIDVVLMTMSAYPSWVSACEVLKEMLEQSYFNVTINEVADTSRYFVGDFDIAMLSIGLPTTFSSYSVLFDASTGFNLSQLSGEADEAVLAAFGAIADEETAHAAMQAVVDTLAYVPIYYPTVYIAFDGDLNIGTFYVDSGIFFYREFSWN